MTENRSEQSRRYWAGLCVYLRQRGSQLESLEPMVSDYKHYRDFLIGRTWGGSESKTAGEDRDAGWKRTQCCVYITRS